MSRKRCACAALGFVVVALISPCSATRAWAAPDDKAIKEAASLRAEGKFPEALEVLRVESRRIKSVEGEGSRGLLTVNDLAAEILIDSGALEPARALLEKTIASRRKLIDGGWNDLAADLAGSLLTLVRLETTAKRLPAAAEAAREALVVGGGVAGPDDERVARAEAALVAAIDAIDAALGPDADVTLRARREAAATLTSLGFFAQAIAQEKKCLDSLLLSQDRDAGEVVTAAVGLGRVMKDAGMSADAIEPVEKALEAVRESHPREANTIRRLLGELQFSADHMALAAGTFDSALEAARGESKPSPIDEAGDRLWRLLVEVGRGNEDRLPDWFDPLVKSLARPLQSEAPGAIRALVVAGSVQHALSMPAANLETLSRALTVAAGMKPPDKGLVVELLGYVAGAQIDAGDVAAARKAIEQALPAAERDLGPGDPRVSLLRVLLADALQRDRLPGKSGELAAKALDRGLPRPSDSWEEQATAIYDRIAAASDNADLRERYIARRVDQFGANHANVSSACQAFGVARLAAGDWQAAIECFSRALDIQRSIGGDDGPDVAASLILLAQAERLAGKPRDAVTRATQGLAVWERAAGPEHPGTLSAVEVLVDSKIQAGDAAGVPELLERLCAPRSSGNPVRRAGHLVRLALAGLRATGDKARALELLTTARQLPCWRPEAALTPPDRLRLAFSAALAAHAFGQLGDAAKATESVQVARRLATQAEDPKPILERIEQLAVGGEQPASRP